LLNPSSLTSRNAGTRSRTGNVKSAHENLNMFHSLSQAGAIKGVNRFECFLCVHVASQVVSDGFSAALLKAYIARVLRSHIGGINAGGSAQEELVSDLIKQWVIPSTSSCWLTAANPIERALT